MKVLIMGNNDTSGGGLIVHYSTLARYLQQSGITLMLININDTNKKIFTDKKITEINIPFRPASLLSKAKKYFKLRAAISKAKNFKPDIFVATSLGNGYAMVAKALPATTFKIFEEVHFEAVADPLRIKMVKCFDAVATQTKGMIHPFLKNVSSLKPVAALPCFSKDYDAENFEPIPQIQKIRLAYFGRLAWNKGLKEFINYTNTIFKSEPDLLLDIYGRGPEAEAIKKEIDKYQLHTQITLKGFYNDEDFPSFINSVHGVIIPSIDTEGLPLVLIEAMHFGRPVFATETGAMPEVASFNPHGMVISKKDISSLTKNLSIFINDIRQQKFNASAINAVYKKHFNNEAFLKTWLLMLEDPQKYFAENIDT